MLVGLALLLQTAAPAAAAAPSPADSKRICKSYATLGSRIARTRVCATAKEWEERERNDRTDLNAAQQQMGQARSSGQ